MVHIRETQVRGREWEVLALGVPPRGDSEAMEDLPFAPAPGASFGLGPVLGELGP